MNTLPLVVRHFLVCLEMEYDWSEPIAPYCLRNVLFRYRPPADGSFPFLIPEVWLFARFDGDGDHELSVEVVRVPAPDQLPEDESGELVAAYGPFFVRLGVVTMSLSRGWHLRGVPFSEPGWYEFRLLDADTVLAQEPIYLEQ